MWKVELDPPIPNMPPIDYIYFATGIQTEFTSLPYLQTMLKKHPIHGHGGFPCITEDLMWKDNIPLFMVGRLAALKLGPAAPNIGGAKLGAERVAWAIEDLIRPSGLRDNNDGETGVVEEEGVHRGGLAEYLSGHTNMYSILVDA